MLSNNQLYRDYIQYIEHVMNRSKPTVNSYRYVLGTFVNYCNTPLTELTIHDIEEYFITRSQEIEPSSQNTERSILRSFFLYVDRYRDIRLKFDYSMIKNIKVEKKKIEFVTEEDLVKIAKALSTKQDRLIVALMFSTGMRIGEIVAFRVDDFYGNEITVRSKGGKKRVVAIHDELKEAIHQHIIDNNIKAGAVFRHQQSKKNLPNNQYTVSGLRKRLRRHLEPLGLYKSPHKYRHGNATLLLQNGMDIRTLQEHLGHEDIRTTQRYTHITNNHYKQSYLKHFPQLNINKLVITVDK